MAKRQLVKPQKTFDSLHFFPISNHMEGCTASCEIGEGPSTVTMTVWGGIVNQLSDGVETFDVKLTDKNDKLVRGILKQQDRFDITALIDHLTRQHVAAKKRYHYRQSQRSYNNYRR